MAFINDFFALVWPRHCEACGEALLRHEQYICTHCRVTLPRSGFHLATDHELIRVFAGRIPLRSASSAYLFEKGGRVQKLLHAIKYEAQTELAEFIGREYGRQLREEASQRPDVIVPIPLHSSKLKARGYNQSECFAKGLSEALECPVDSQSLVRVKKTATQTKKHKYQRWENVEGIFKVTTPSAFENRHVLLVDDVITTGATLEAAWLPLSALPGISVSVASIAFAAQHLQ